MKKNKRLLILVGILLVFGGFTFAYFVGRMLTEGSGATTTVTTAELKNSKVTVEGTLEFDYKDMLPGHKDVSGIIVTATGNNELIPYNLVWKGTNNLNTDLKFTVYKVSEQVSVSSKCEKVKKNVSGGQMLYEECEITNLSSLGEAIGSGTIKRNNVDTTITIAPNEFITSTSTGAKTYYYVVIEYPNLDGSQNLDMGQGFEGEVTVEPSNIEPDINILAINIEQEDGTYKEVKKLPTKEDGYSFNSEKSTCNNEVTLIWNRSLWNLTLNNLTQSGTECYLYFMKPLSTKTLEKLGDFNIVESPESFNSSDSYDHGNMLYYTDDNDGISYFYRGLAKNNWVKFGTNDDETKDIWWRIIRINGNGTIRLIYQGMYDKGVNPDPENLGYVKGTQTLIASSQYNKSNDSTYIGFYYGSENGKYPDNHSNTTPSLVAEQLKIWYDGENWNDEYNQYIDLNTGFCNDRTIHPDAKTWFYNESTSGRGAGNSTTVYGAYSRLYIRDAAYKENQMPSLLCGINPNPKKNDGSDEISITDYERDLYTPIGSKIGNGVLEVPIGLITIDEAIFAGTYLRSGVNCYLNNGQSFWTMSPMQTGSWARIFQLDSGTVPTSEYATTSAGIRPVINLKADLTFTGSGTTEDPYIVETN